MSYMHSRRRAGKENRDGIYHVTLCSSYDLCRKCSGIQYQKCKTLRQDHPCRSCYDDGCVSVHGVTMKVNTTS